MTQRVDRQAPVMSTRVHRAVTAATASRPVHAVSHDGGPLPPGEVATLTAALQYPGLDRKRLGILTGYKRSSRDAYIARLASKGLVEVNGAALFPTDAGRAALNGSFEPLPTGADLIEYWRTRLPEGERRVLDVLLSGGEVEREKIDEVTGYKRSSRDAYLVRLKARGLVEFSGRGTVTASAELFE
jgi:DNA-binding MarR family transcriptional regulator